MVATGRHMDPDKVRELADGRAYTGRQALQLGLIDAIGGEHEARAMAGQAKGVSANLPVRGCRDRRACRAGVCGELSADCSRRLWKTVAFPMGYA